MEKQYWDSKNKERYISEKERDMSCENFYKRYFESDTTGVKRISLEMLWELKEKGISTENMLDHICKKRGKLLHGSIHEIKGDILESKYNKIFASNRSSIAIMRSIYSNIGVNLQYPYFINEESPLVLKIHTPPDGKFIKTNKGFIYIVDNSGFKNEPEGSWQFIKESDEVKFNAVVEIESDDFIYPVEFFNDLDLDE